MSAPLSCIVWIDNTEARVLHLRGDEQGKVLIHSHSSVQRLHQKAHGGAHPVADGEFFERIAGTLQAARSTVLTGPGSTKLALRHYLELSHPGIAAHAQVSEAMPARAGDEGLLDLAHGFFRSAGVA